VVDTASVSGIELCLDLRSVMILSSSSLVDATPDTKVCCPTRDACNLRAACVLRYAAGIVHVVVRRLRASISGADCIGLQYVIVGVDALHTTGPYEGCIRR